MFDEWGNWIVRLGSDDEVSQEELHEWDFLSAQFERLSAAYRDAYGGVDVYDSPHGDGLPARGPSVLPLYLRRLLPISDDGWFHTPDQVAPRRVERRYRWCLQHSIRRACVPTDRQERSPHVLLDYGDHRFGVPLDRPKHVVPLSGEPREQMLALVTRIACRAADRASVGRAEAMIKLAIKRAEFRISLLDHADADTLPAHAISPYHEDEWMLPQEMWHEEHFYFQHDVSERRRLLTWRLEWLRRWRKIEKTRNVRIRARWERQAEAAKALAKAEARKPGNENGLNFALNSFTAYIKPKDIQAAQALYDEAISELPKDDPNHYNSTVCLGHWYLTMLYISGASWWDLLAIYNHHKAYLNKRRSKTTETKRRSNRPKAPKEPRREEHASDDAFEQARLTYISRRQRWSRTALMRAGLMAKRHNSQEPAMVEVGYAHFKRRRKELLAKDRGED